MYKLIIIFLVSLSTLNCSGGDGGLSTTATPISEADLKLSNFSYKGAFTMAKEYGAYKSRGAAGVFELSADKSSFYFGGRKIDTIIGEFELPELVISDDVADLNVAVAKQNYSSMIGSEEDIPQFEGLRIPSSNPDRIDRITGLFLYNDMLVANVVKYYDSDAPNTHTTMVIADPANLDTSDIYGFFSLEGKAHAAGWISEIPPEWRDTLGGDILTGWASSFPIASRNSIGPSAFVVNSSDIDPFAAPESSIATTTLMDFSLATPLHTDKCNNNETALCNQPEAGDLPPEVGTNDLWTVVSWAVYGFIVPGTHTYAVFGSSGGHFTGVGYKITQDNGYTCSGPCAPEYDDYYNYYWFFDVDDLVAVKNGQKLAHEVLPYSYGIFPAPFQTDYDDDKWGFIPVRTIRGGKYDSASKTLYLVLGGSIQEQQIIVAYDVTITE